MDLGGRLLVAAKLRCVLARAYRSKRHPKSEYSGHPSGSQPVEQVASGRSSSKNLGVEIIIALANEPLTPRHDECQGVVFGLGGGHVRGPRAGDRGDDVGGRGERIALEQGFMEALIA